VVPYTPVLPFEGDAPFTGVPKIGAHVRNARDERCSLVRRIMRTRSSMRRCMRPRGDGRRGKEKVLQKETRLTSAPLQAKEDVDSRPANSTAVHKPIDICVRLGLDFSAAGHEQSTRRATFNRSAPSSTRQKTPTTRLASAPSSTRHTFSTDVCLEVCSGACSQVENRSQCNFHQSNNWRQKTPTARLASHPTD